MKRILRLGLLLSMVFCSGYVAADRFEDEINNYISIFKTGAPQDQIMACQEIEGSGLSDHRLFDEIEKNFLALSNTKDEKTKDLVAWYAKALGSSGEDKYSDSLKKVMDSSADKKIVKYAGEGMVLLHQHKLWNPIISDKKNFKESESLATNRIVNMLKSDDQDLKILGIKRLRQGRHHDDYILDTLSDEILKVYKFTTKYQLQTVEAMVRALGEMQSPKYLPTLKEVSLNSNHDHLKKFTKKIIARNYR